MERRQFFKSSLMLGGVLLPAVLVGCGNSMESLKHEKMPAEPLSPQDSYNEGWDARAAQLENVGLVKTRENRADHDAPQDEIDLHIPLVMLNSKSIALQLNHAMHKEHWITTVYVKDQFNRVFGIQEFVPTDTRAWADFPIPEGTTAITAYSFCSTHGLWCTKVSIV